MLRCLLVCISCCCFRKEGKRIADSLLTASLFSALRVAADEYLVTALVGGEVLILYLGFRAPSAGGCGQKMPQPGFCSEWSTDSAGGPWAGKVSV